ncbi:OOP family OmpA-OmpF porin [Neisseria sp. HSC-16F19]|nr:OmpA family protein [Neisseria sp. HSC-16F19]MCP2040407.1 OOP family OmpA-OmpF porin [Neisseria sp. HSC-16F19]
MAQKHRFQKQVCALAAALLLAGTAWADTLHHAPVEHWVDFKSNDARFAVPENKAGVVVYRRNGEINGPSANIYVNGEYLASLLPGGFRYTTVCPQGQRLDAEFTGVAYDDGYIKKERKGEYVDMPAGSISYFKVVNDGRGNPQIVRVPAEQARADLKNMREQVHTLKRVERETNCDGRAIQPVALKKFTLDAGALFAFDRADYANMLPQGKQEIARVAQEIRQGGMQVQRIQVVGYTDPEGSDSYNQQLSYRRAETVKRALGESGLNPQLIQAEGLGEQNLIVPDCRRQHPSNAQARKQCDQPNRRVEITLFGAQ